MPCDSPFYVMPKAGTVKVPVPCGKCPPCKKRRVDSWVFRLMKEYDMYEDAHFVTLTYDTQHVPISPNGFLTLSKEDLQKYFKRLRKLCDSVRIRYYACGEYGSKNRRPHYHFIVFGVSNTRFFFDAWCLGGVPFGSVHIGKVSKDSVAYTLKYIDKSRFQRMHGRDDRVPEFSLMSKRLGSNYLTDAVVSYHKADLSRVCVVHRGGSRVAMPRYYRDKIFTDAEKRYQMRLCEAAEQQRMSDLRFEYQRTYGVDHPDFSFDQWLTSKKYGRYHSFYHNQNRKL